MIDALLRLLPGSLGDEASRIRAFPEHLLDFPTTPAGVIDGLEFRVCSRATTKISALADEARRRTFRRRPDCLHARLSAPGAVAREYLRSVLCRRQSGNY